MEATTLVKVDAIVADIENQFRGNRTAKMRAIFDTLTADGVTDPRELRDACARPDLWADAPEGRINTGAIYNAWSRWNNQRLGITPEPRQRAQRTAAPSQPELVQTSSQPVDYNELTFGVELECGFKARRWGSSLVVEGNLTVCREGIDLIIEKARQYGIEAYDSMHNYNHHDSDTAWKIMRDGSLRSSSGVVGMLEIVSPVLKGRNGWKQLEIMLLILEQVGCNVNSSCGTHVHIGMQNEPWTTLRNVAINYSLAFGAYCKVIEESRRDTDWARNFSQRALSELRCAESIGEARQARATRYHAVNLCSYTRHNTVEFRQHGATVDFRKLQSWIHDKMELVIWSRTNVLGHRTDSVQDMAWHTEDTRNNFETREFRYNNNL